MAATVLKKTTVDIADGAVAAVTGLPSVGEVAVQLTGTFSATVTFEGTVDNVNWVAMNMVPAASSTGASTATTAGFWSTETRGLSGLRVRVSTFSSSASGVMSIRYVAN
jgi:hypothetical protein